jgi:asparagine synthase (glutamine-hydrolysing)
MGFIAGCASRDGSDVSHLLTQMALRLRHRGDPPICVFSRVGERWSNFLVQQENDVATSTTGFGILGSRLKRPGEKVEIPFTDSSGTRFLLLDGQFFNCHELKEHFSRSHKDFPENPSIVVHILEEMQRRVLNFTEIFQKLFTLLEGMFAGVLILKHHVFIFRDLLGIKPMYLYAGPRYIAFASERKALWGAGLTQGIDSMRPGRVVRVAQKGFTSHFQAHLADRGTQEYPLTKYVKLLQTSLETSLKSLDPGVRFYLLLSGGIDSTLLAALCKSGDLDFSPLVIGSPNAKDIKAAQLAAEKLELPLEVLNFDLASLEKEIPRLLYHVEDRDEKKLNIAFPLFLGAKYIKGKHHDIVFTGQGADELFGGYERHERLYIQDPANFQGALWDDVKNLYRVNLERDDAATMAGGVELRLPFLSRQTVELAMQIPAALKLQPPIRKYILRELGRKYLPEELVQQPKRAIQFSSGSYVTLKKLAKQLGFTKEFVLNHGFFSPTQIFIDTLAHLLGFPNISPKIVKFVAQTRIDWPEAILKYENYVNQII